MTKNPLVSIIMPLYNKRPYVKRAIDSIQKQTVDDWELIIVDDGSTDGSIIDVPQNDSRVRLFQQKNKGPGAARNRGINNASGKFVTFIDADDYYYSNKLEVEMNSLHKDNKADWMISPFEYEKDNEISVRYVQDINGKVVNQPLVVENAFKDLKLYGLHINGICIKKKILNHLNGFSEHMRCLEITEFLIRCALLQPRVIIYHLPLYRIIDVPYSAFKISSHKIEGSRLMGESLFNLSNQYPEHSNFLRMSSQRNLLSFVVSLILLNNKQEAREYLTKKYPYDHGSKWWKIWLGSWLPVWLLRRLL